ALIAGNDGDVMPYGADPHTRRAEARFREVFEREVAVAMMATGTASNALALGLVASPISAIFCRSGAHLQDNEAGASVMHMDGARFANALAHLECQPAEMSWRAGIDVLSFGATKNGAMAAEAVLVFDPTLAEGLRARLKRGGLMFSKHRFLGIQFNAYLA